LTEAVVAEAYRLAGLGVSKECLAALLGIANSTVYEWVRRGAREQRPLRRNPEAQPNPAEELFVRFSEAVKRGIAECQARDLKTIEAASATHWQAAAWRLERRFAETFGQLRFQRHLDKVNTLLKDLEKRSNDLDKISAVGPVGDEEKGRRSDEQPDLWEDPEDEELL
jgi:hypothetical protein